MDNLPIPARPATPQVLIHRLPDKSEDASDPACAHPQKYVILITGPISFPGKAQITHSVARALSCPSYLGDSIHSSSAKAAGVGTAPGARPNEARYQRMWLSKMTRTGLLFPEESRPATEGFSGFGGGWSSASTSRRASTSSLSTATPDSSVASDKGRSEPGHFSAEAPSSGSNTFFAASETERLRRKTPAAMVVVHPELKGWHRLAIRKALAEYLVGVIFVPLQEPETDAAEEDEELPVLRPLDPATMAAFPTDREASARRPRGGGNLEDEMEIRVASGADLDGKIQDIIQCVRDVMGIDD